MYKIIVLYLFTFYNQSTSSSTSECLKDQFKLNGMKNCHALLTCENVKQMTVLKRLGTGAVKDVFLFRWKEYEIVVSVPVNTQYLKDFLDGVNVLKLLNPSKFVVQFLGFCPENNILMTEYHKLGNFLDYLKTKPLVSNSVQRVELCFKYASILNHLHHGPAGRRVFCDSNSLDKLLSQLLITSDFRIILNDVDAVPEVTDLSVIKCGHREIKGDFVAPEQLWTITNDSFDDALMPGYNEKTDIWKAASVCEFFLKGAEDEEVLKYRLFEVHRKCKNKTPLLRPTAQVLLKEYNKVIEDIGEVIHVEL